MRSGRYGNSGENLSDPVGLTGEHVPRSVGTSGGQKFLEGSFYNDLSTG